MDKWKKEFDKGKRKALKALFKDTDDLSMERKMLKRTLFEIEWTKLEAFTTGFLAGLKQKGANDE